MKITKINYFGIDHDKLVKKYGNLLLLNTFCVYGEETPTMVFKAVNPDRSKGHKDYFLFSVIHDPDAKEYGAEEKVAFVRGADLKELEPYRYQTAIHCQICDDLIYSAFRHDFRKCSCEAVFVDGGAEYLHCGGPGLDSSVAYTLDLLTDNIFPEALETNTPN